MLIFASVFWLIGYGLEYLQKRWNINRLADDIILPH
jgi:hypothetical protein